ncbi:MAG: vitamin B12-dependent ribonucleotide reductase [Dehalococcoidales bacterium]|nr:vitamin B12-dependent ribonucleotide reductase [Dehalococcoidales bacterium]
MSNKNKPGQQLSQFTRNQIAKATFSVAERMGISDRQHIEKLTQQVIERLEKKLIHDKVILVQPLPGMEGFVPVPHSLERRVTTNESEILALVREFLDAEEAKKPREDISPMENTKTDKMENKQDSEIKLTENALRVLEKRYLGKDKNGQPSETPEQLFRRVARAIAAAELIYNAKADIGKYEDNFYSVMTNLDFLPNSPTLMNAGRELGQLSACFVLPIEDSMESIFDAVKYTALIHKSGGGTGFSFSRLRPESDRVGSTGGVASGPVSFMRAFDTATDVIKQGGMRRGANMAILSVDHPDIVKFINAKNDPNVLTNFNISVAVTKEFMEAVKTGSNYNLINPHNKEVAGQLNAKEVFDKMVEMAWKTGDPGIVFIDLINNDNPTPHLGKIESTNPCGEQPLLPYESCNLGSINLSRMLSKTGNKVQMDYPKLARTVKTAVRFLDNVIDVNKFPLSLIDEMTKKTRKIGLGVMGYADMLLQLGIPYDSEAALEVVEDVMGFIQAEATKASVELAVERGVFPAFKGSKYDVPGGLKVRNATRTTIAPTGTLSIIAGCSGGIEPLFALVYTRNILDGAQMLEANPYFEEVARKRGFYTDELMKKLGSGAHLSDITGIPTDDKKLFVTAHEINPEWHVEMQSIFQKYTDNAVSKTVNFSHEAGKDDVANVYMLAYEKGLKGITIYRDRSREGQPMSIGQAVEKKPDTKITPRKRAKRTTGITERVNTGCGSLYVTVNSDDAGICEVFSNLGKAGGCASAQLEATCRLISLALRSGVDVNTVIKQLRGIRCPSIAWEGGKSVLSCADAIASVLERHVGVEIEAVEKEEIPQGKMMSKTEDFGLVRNIAGQCPDCGGLLAYQEGCFVCPNCGYTKC